MRLIKTFLITILLIGFAFMQTGTDKTKFSFSAYDQSILSIADDDTLDLTIRRVTDYYGNYAPFSLSKDTLRIDSLKVLLFDPDAEVVGLAANETDPQVGANTANYIPKWDGSALIASASIYEDGSENVGIGIPNPYTKLHINGEMRFFPREQQGIASFIYDDGKDTDSTYMLPMFQAQGEVANSAITINLVGTSGYLTWTEISTLDTAGWEIMSHGLVHMLLDTASTATITNQLSASQDTLQGRGYDANNFVYPGFANNQEVRRITREYYRSARAGGDSAPNLLPLETYELRAVNTENYTTAQYQALVDSADAQNSWVIFLLHITDADDVDTLNIVIDYIQSLGLEIMTVDDALDAIGNMIDVGDYVAINEDGLRAERIHGNSYFQNWVSIGIETPVAPLHINRPTGTGYNIFTQHSGAADGTTSVFAYLDQGGGVSWQFSAKNLVDVTARSDFSLTMKNMADAFYVTAYGKIGLNTGSPQHNLSLYTPSPWFALTDTNTNINVSNSAQAVDTSAIYLETEGTPTIAMRGVDGDGWAMSINTSDQMLFQSASGGYDFDNNLIIGTDNLYPVLGYATGNNVMRTIKFKALGTALSTTCTFSTTALHNGETLASETTTEGSGGTRFEHNGGGQVTIKGLSTVVGIGPYSMVGTSTGTHYDPFVDFSGSNIICNFRNLVGAAQVYSDIADGKYIQYIITYYTSE